MQAKKPTAMMAQIINNRKQLQYLYARMSKLDALIQSLEQYHRLQEQAPADIKRRTA
ncbi:MAG TPA: hypothetical protein VHW24_25275 [Bryobacteraceae bacterium]|jgi:hypothetical protein|nr:hypothetical protein [Bryobacteraceae bacterium]